ncbi:hypothetical protein NDU88_007249 [Pleurodeles waltl]|uniref:Uncharacterized protein n=1 Tax=Pleurodeles waltl TaxID=8319 RepID=A0AAV7NSK1_PLEWA|nr:hypothetical protein NDU88_007249 [Pleurodeles waltl]
MTRIPHVRSTADRATRRQQQAEASHALGDHGLTSSVDMEQLSEFTPQSNKMDKYTVTRPATDAAGAPSVPPSELEPSLSEIMAAICDPKNTLEPKHDAVTVDITVLRAYFKKLSEKITAVNIAVLQKMSGGTSTIPDQANYYGDR